MRIVLTRSQQESGIALGNAGEGLSPAAGASPRPQQSEEEAVECAPSTLLALLHDADLSGGGGSSHVPYFFPVPTVGGSGLSRSGTSFEEKGSLFAGSGDGVRPPSSPIQPVPDEVEQSLLEMLMGRRPVTTSFQNVRCC